MSLSLRAVITIAVPFLQIVSLWNCRQDVSDLIDNQKPSSTSPASDGSGGGAGGGTPSVINVTSPLADGSYAANSSVSVDIQVTFSAAVNVTGTPRITIATGSPPSKFANYTSGSGTNTLTFNFTTTAGMSSADLEYTATTALTLNGGTIKSSGGVDADLALPGLGATGSLGNNKAIVIF